MPFVEADFLRTVKRAVNSKGYCVVVVSEGVRRKNGRFLSESGSKDAFGHVQLGGVAPVIADMIGRKLATRIIGRWLTIYNVRQNISATDAGKPIL